MDSGIEFGHQRVTSPPTCANSFCRSLGRLSSNTSRTSRAMRRVALIISIAYCAFTVRCQLDANAYDPLCNSTIDLANATGIAEYQPDFAQGPQITQRNNTSGRTLPAYVSTTVTDDNKSSSLWITTWVNTNGANYSDDAKLGYDVCGMALTNIPDNTELRAQNDSGDCWAMLDQPCVDGINSAAEEYALRLVLNPPAGTNINSSNVSWISKICPELANMLNSNPPEACSPYFWPNTTWYAATALTDWNSSSLYGGCQSRPAPGSNLLSPWWSINSGGIHYSEQIYDYVVHHTSPILGVWMTVANSGTIKPAVPTNSAALLRCIKPGQNISKGSRVPATLPAPSPVAPFSKSASSIAAASTSSNDKHKITAGGIAGIVVGLVVGGALIGGALAWWWLRRKPRKEKQQQQETTESELADTAARVDSKEVVELPQPEHIHELDSERKTAELEGKWTVELEGSIPTSPPPPISPQSSAVPTSLSPVSPEESKKGNYH